MTNKKGKSGKLLDEISGQTARGVVRGTATAVTGGLGHVIAPAGGWIPHGPSGGHIIRNTFQGIEMQSAGELATSGAGLLGTMKDAIGQATEPLTKDKRRRR